MLPYQEDAKKLEKLLESLFEDDNSDIEGIKVWKKPGFSTTSSSCCHYTYTSY